MIAAVSWHLSEKVPAYHGKTAKYEATQCLVGLEGEQQSLSIYPTVPDTNNGPQLSVVEQTMVRRHFSPGPNDRVLTAALVEIYSAEKFL